MLRKSTKSFELFALSLALASCVTRSAPAPSVRPERPPPAVCAAVADEPALPDAAGLVQPVTDAEKAAVRAFLTWAAQYADWARAMKARAVATQAWCGG